MGGEACRTFVQVVECCVMTSRISRIRSSLLSCGSWIGREEEFVGVREEEKISLGRMM